VTVAGSVLVDAGAGDEVAERRRTSRPGASRKKSFGGFSMKSSRSIHSSPENGTCRVPAVGSSGLFWASTISTWLAGAASCRSPA
jgi:hypothetical protein